MKGAAAVAAAACSALLLTGCGGSNDASSGPVVIGSWTPPPKPSATPAASASGPADGPASTPADPVAAAGRPITDPQGTYTMTINRKWIRSKVSGAVEYWRVGVSSRGVIPQVSASSEELGASGQGISLPSYLKDSATNLAKQGKATILKQGTLRGADSSRLGALEYTAYQQPGVLAHYLAIIDVSETEAVVVTLRTPPASFRKYRAAVQPFMATVQAKG